MADLVVVHKADRGNELFVRTLHQRIDLLHLFPRPQGEHTVEVLTASSYTGDGHNDQI